MAKSPTAADFFNPVGTVLSGAMGVFGALTARGNAQAIVDELERTAEAEGVRFSELTKQIHFNTERQIRNASHESQRAVGNAVNTIDPRSIAQVGALAAYVADRTATSEAIKMERDRRLTAIEFERDARQRQLNSLSVDPSAATGNAIFAGAAQTASQFMQDRQAASQSAQSAQAANQSAQMAAIQQQQLQVQLQNQQTMQNINAQFRATQQSAQLMQQAYYRAQFKSAAQKHQQVYGQRLSPARIR